MSFLDKLKCWGLEFKVDKSKFIILLLFGIGIACMSVLSAEPIRLWKVVAALAVCVAVTFINIKLPKLWYTVSAELVLIVGAITCYVVTELIYFSTIRLNGWNIFINALPMYALAKLVYVLFRNLTLAVFVPLLVSYVFSVAAYYVLLFRGTPLLPWDITAISTAATVADNFIYVIPKMFVYALVICALAILMTMMVKHKATDDKKVAKKSMPINIGSVVLAIAVWALGVYPNLSANLWNPQGKYTDQGLVAGFIAHVKYCKSDSISGYSYEDVDRQIANVDAVEMAGVEAENIIVIMNEAFSDLRVINNEIISDEYMPFIDSLEENTIKGELYVPVFGAQTCDSEFEVLVGASTQYTSATPYQSVMKKDTESMVSYLKERGYYAQAFHPYPAANWNRDDAYKYLGFEEFLDISVVYEMGYEGSFKLRGYCSDDADFYKVIKEYEKNNDEKYFMFNVTMQNHSGYEKQYEDLPITADLSAYGEYPLAETYLSLIKKSDEAFQGLIEYFSQVEEPTLICMFGDHMPKIESEFYTLLYGKAEEELTEPEKQKKYITPVIIWANYDIEEKYLDKISSNFLALEIFKAANIDLEGYWSLLNDVYERYPVLSKTGTIDKNGNYYVTDDIKEEELIRLQRSIQYYRLYQK